MRLSIILFIFFSVTLLSCQDDKIYSGEIEYEITYPHNNLSKLMDMMLPKTMTIIFKGDKMITTIKKGNLFTTKVISNENTKELEMRLKMGSDIFNTFLNKEDVTSFLNSQPKYNFSKLANSDSLINCTSIHYKTDSPSDSIDDFHSVFTTDLSVQNASWFTSYNEIAGMPLEYLLDRYGLQMKVKAVKLTERHVEDSEFSPEFKYQKIPYQRYNKRVQDLFDVMLN